MKRRIIVALLSFLLAFQNFAVGYWTAAAIGGFMAFATIVNAEEYNPTYPPTTVPVADDADGDGEFGPFDYTQEAMNIGIGAISRGIPSASESGTNIWYTDQNGVTQNWEMNDTSSPETSMFPAGYNDESAYSVDDLKDGFGPGGNTQLNLMVDEQRVAIDAEDPSANPSIIGMAVRDMDAQAESDIYKDMRNDPIVYQAALVEQGVAEDFNNIFTDCEVIATPGSLEGGNVEADCVRTAGSLPSTCTLSNQVRLTPIGGEATVVGLIIDDSGSMGSGPGSFMAQAIGAGLVIANSMDEAVNTELYTRSFKTSVVQDWPDTSASAANAYNNLVAGGGTPLGATMADMVIRLNARPEPNKIIISISDGVPNDSSLVNSTIINNPGITWYGLGIQQPNMASFPWDDVEIVSGSNVDVGIFNLLSGSFVLSNIWEGDECLVVAELVSAGVIEASASCTTLPNSSGCVFVDTLWVCPGTPWASQLSPTPFPTQVGPLCGAITVTGITYSSSNCWVDASGDTNCVGDPGLNSCGVYIDDPSWGIYDTRCIPGAINPSTGECLLYGETYLGGYGNPVDATATALPGCAAPIACADGSCINPPIEQNANFAQASASLNMTFQAAMDHECDVARTDTCIIFKGEGWSCHRTGDIEYEDTLGSWVIAADCCEEYAVIGMQEYLALGKFVYEQEATQAMLNAMQDWAVDTYSTASTTISNTEAFNYLKGAWSDLTNYVTQTDLWQTVSKPIGTFVDSLASKTAESGLSSISTGVTNTIASLQSAVMNYMGEVLRSFGPVGEALVGSTSAAAGSASTGASSGTSSGALGETTVQLDSAGNAVPGTETTTFNAAGNIFSTIMMAYMIYQLIVLAINLIDGCEPEEFEFNTKREMGSCGPIRKVCTLQIPDANVPIGPTGPRMTCGREEWRACCFGSPLSRIVNEQASFQGVGTPIWTDDGIDCGGLTVNELGSLDWSRMDLSEWTELLATTDQIPEHATKPVGLPASTYDASTVGDLTYATSDRGEAYSDAVERIEDITNFDMDDVRETTNRILMEGGDSSTLYTAPPAP